MVELPLKRFDLRETNNQRARTDQSASAMAWQNRGRPTNFPETRFYSPHHSLPRFTPRDHTSPRFPSRDYLSPDRPPRDRSPRDRPPRDRSSRDRPPRDRPRDRSPRDRPPRDRSPRVRSPRVRSPRVRSPRDRSLHVRSRRVRSRRVRSLRDRSPRDCPPRDCPPRDRPPTLLSPLNHIPLHFHPPGHPPYSHPSPVPFEYWRDTPITEYSFTSHQLPFDFREPPPPHPVPVSNSISPDPPLPYNPSGSSHVTSSEKIPVAPNKSSEEYPDSGKDLTTQASLVSSETCLNVNPMSSVMISKDGELKGVDRHSLRRSVSDKKLEGCTTTPASVTKPSPSRDNQVLGVKTELPLRIKPEMDLVDPGFFKTEDKCQVGDEKETTQPIKRAKRKLSNEGSFNPAAEETVSRDHLLYRFLVCELAMRSLSKCIEGGLCLSTIEEAQIVQDVLILLLFLKSSGDVALLCSLGVVDVLAGQNAKGNFVVTHQASSKSFTLSCSEINYLKNYIRNVRPNLTKDSFGLLFKNGDSPFTALTLCQSLRHCWSKAHVGLDMSVLWRCVGHKPDDYQPTASDILDTRDSAVSSALENNGSGVPALSNTRELAMQTNEVVPQWPDGSTRNGCSTRLPCGVAGVADDTKETKLLNTSVNDHQTRMVSDTKKFKTKKLMTKALKQKLVDVSTLKNPVTADAVKQAYMICPTEKKFLLLYSIIKNFDQKKKMMVFFSCCDAVKFYYELLAQMRVNVLCIHGKQEQSSNASSYYSFTSASSATLLCTDETASEWVVPEVDYVLQYDPPLDPSEYIQRVDRVACGEALLLLREEELPFVKCLEKRKAHLTEQAFELDKLPNMQQKVESIVENVTVLNWWGRKALKSCINSYTLHHREDIFNINTLDIRKLGESFGLSQPSKVDLVINPKKDSEKTHLQGITESLEDAYGVSEKDKTAVDEKAALGAEEQNLKEDGVANSVMGDPDNKNKKERKSEKRSVDDTEHSEGQKKQESKKRKVVEDGEVESFSNDKNNSKEPTRNEVTFDGDNGNNNQKTKPLPRKKKKNRSKKLFKRGKKKTEPKQLSRCDSQFCQITSIQVSNKMKQKSKSNRQFVPNGDVLKKSQNQTKKKSKTRKVAEVGGSNNKDLDHGVAAALTGDRNQGKKTVKSFNKSKKNSKKRKVDEGRKFDVSNLNENLEYGFVNNVNRKKKKSRGRWYGGTHGTNPMSFV